MIYSKIFVNGSDLSDVYDYTIKKSISDNNASSNFSAQVENFAGRHKSDFSVGQEVKIYADNDIIQPGSSPVFQFRFNEGAGSVTYDSIQNVIGSIVSGTFALGKIGSSVSLVGSPAVSHIDIGGTISKFPSGAGTISMWYYPTRSSAGIVEPLIHYGSGASADTAGPENEFYFVRRGDTGSIIFQYYDAGTAKINIIKNYNETLNSWHHVVGTWAGINNYANLYVDSVLLGSTLQTGHINTGSFAKGYIAGMIATPPGTLRNFAGNIDDFRIYNYPLSQSDVNLIYNNGNGTETPSNGSQTVFTGIVEGIKYVGQGIDEKINLSGRDYAARLVDRTVEPEVYTNWEIGSIVRDLISKYSSDVTTNNVQSVPGTLSRISFNQTPLYDSIKQLADLAGYNFYVDVNKDLHFEPVGSIASGYTFSNGSNVIAGDFTVDRESLYNQVWVYGDRYLDNYQQTFVAGSYSAYYSGLQASGLNGSLYYVVNNGSTFPLLYNPNNTEVTVNGGSIQPGNLQNVNATPPSGTKYVIAYDDKLIVFTSGTNYGNNIPAPSASVIVKYKRSLPIVKVGDNEVSKALYSQRTKVIIDKNIKDPLTAQKVMEQQLADFSDPAIEGNIDVRGVANINVGQTALVNFPYQGINNQTYNIIEANYDFNKDNNLKNQVLSLKMNRRIGDVTDTLKDILLAQKKIQAGDITTSDVITRFQFSTGSMGLRTSGLKVLQRYTGSDLLWGVARITAAIPGGWSWGSGAWTNTYSYPTQNVVWSGGYLT